MKFYTSIVGGKAPGDGTVLSIALGLQRRDALAQLLQTCHSTRQTTARKDTDLDLGHIEPTTVFGRVMKLHALQNPASLCRLEGFIQGRSGMGVQVILHDANI